VDPALHQARGAMDDAELRAHRDLHRTLVDASAPVMAAARDFLSDSGSVLLLTDARGLILAVEGDPDTLERGEEIRLVPGVSWGELATGTNAIGTALAIGRPVQVHAAEHFCEGIKTWTCAAAAVRDPCDGRIIGALDVSGASGSYSRQSLAFVVSAATQIETCLKELELGLRFRILERCLVPLSTVHAEGVVLFDRRGFALKANDHAAALLAGRGKTLAAGSALRVEAFDLEALGTRPALPDWLPAARVEPVLDRRERIGTLVVLGAEGARRSRTARAEPEQRPPGPDGFADLVGPSAALGEAVRRARTLARVRTPVLLLGETGVGKELFAHGIHQSGDAAAAPFVAVNCAGFARDLLASELFGYADGAFTGARRGGMPGKLEGAGGGTLFLDEIGEMPLELQGHLLRALEAGEIYRIGESRPRKVQFRLISATNRDLRGEVAAGRFRMDLFYRVAVTTLNIAPLRERREDIAPLAESFLRKLAEERGGPRCLSPEALAGLTAYAWPGNVRELRNVIEAMRLESEGDSLAWDDLPEEIRASTPGAPPGPPLVAEDLLQQAEAEAIRAAVRAQAGNLTRAAHRLGIAKSTLYAKIKAYGLSGELGRVREAGASGRTGETPSRRGGPAGGQG
jgi:transcriptional regulator of acetoin/glycerol metabolism